jgi:predicted Zn-dependent protease
LANRLLLLLASHLEDLPAFEAALDRLRRAGEDTALEHAAYWRLLHRQGRPDEAQRLGLAFSRKIQSAREIVALMEAYAEIGLFDSVRRLFREVPSTDSPPQEVWLKYAELLTSAKSWEELRSVAVQVRNQAQGPRHLTGYTYFLEGWAEAELGRERSAKEAFDRMGQVWGTGGGALVLAAATTLNRLGRSDAARVLLAKCKDELRTQFAYWSVVLSTAEKLKDHVLLLEAARNEYEMEPNNPAALNHYSAALLISRQEPEKAIRFTMKLLAEYPRIPGSRINHAFALLLNHRAEEARALLENIRPGALTAEEANAFYLASFYA